MWTIAFLTGTPGASVARHLPPDCLAVYVPTTPNPTGGYFVIVERKDVIELDMTVDQALKDIISMGVVPPLEKGAAPPPEKEPNENSLLRLAERRAGRPHGDTVRLGWPSPRPRRRDLRRPARPRRARAGRVQSRPPGGVRYRGAHPQRIRAAGQRQDP